MANNPFDRTPVYPLEKPLSVDINQGAAQLDYSMRLLMQQLLSSRSSSPLYSGAPKNGFLGNSFLVSPTSPTSLNVTVKSGVGFIYDAADTPAAIDGVLGLDDLSAYKPVVLMNDVTFTATIPSGANLRRDIIEVRIDRLLGNPTSRQVLDTDSGNFNPDSLDKTLSFTVDGSVGYVTSPALSTAALSYKFGVEAGSPATPTVTPGYVVVGQVRTSFADTSVLATSIADMRPFSVPGNVLPWSASWRLQFNGGAGAQIATLITVNAPPGVQIGLDPNAGTRGKGIIYATGGDFVRGNVAVNSYSYASLPADESITLCGGAAPAMQVVTSALFATLAALTPAVVCGGGAPVLLTTFEHRWQSGATTNSTDTALEDLVITASGMFSY